MRLELPTISYCYQQCPHCRSYWKWEWYTNHGYPCLVTCWRCHKRFPLTGRPRGTRPDWIPNLTQSVFV
jgi:hypothetical protein